MKLGELGLGGGWEVGGQKRRGDAESLGEKGGAPALMSFRGDESRSARRRRLQPAAPAKR